ncbi:MAG: GIY-YIG nuclease family protein [Candidatus Hydrogenedentes bacterium]|nr:GIY-YIG nuclease family protein [Candidatus Hydrogenedentota bacterium]
MTRENPYYVYMLRCADDTIYTGITTDLERRVRVHNDGKGAKYTRTRTPVELVYSEPFESKSEALKREWQIKKLSRSEKLQMF